MTSQSISLIQTAGGLGLFLLGMVVMTDALKAIAGSSIRAVLMRFTRSPVSGALTGAFSTALLQSSSATTVAAVGFVGAGLMGFSSALGIVFGANLGTTITGWIVAVIGFKLQLASVLMPCILIGALTRLFSRGKLASAGLALAGFGLVFVGIDQMQAGMSGMQGMVAELNLPSDTYFDRLKLLLIGVLFTMLTQSSSAGIAAVLTALFTDALTLGQGLALVIGMDIGTTVTAVIATIGGSVGARRTGYSHLVYNLLTGIVAFLLLQPYLTFWQSLDPEQLSSNKEFLLVGFHSGFNLLGVLLILPFARQFASLMERIVPEPSPSYVSALDMSLLQEPALALRAVRSAVAAEYKALLLYTRSLLSSSSPAERVNLVELQKALDETHTYLDMIQVGSEDQSWHELVGFFHILDHLQRFHERCDEDAYRAIPARSTEQLAITGNKLNEAVSVIVQAVEEHNWEGAAAAGLEVAEDIASSTQSIRGEIMQQVAADLTVAQATDLLESIRWMRRVSHHVGQIARYLDNPQRP